MLVWYESYRKTFCYSRPQIVICTLLFYWSSDILSDATVMQGIQPQLKVSFISKSIRCSFHHFYLVVDAFNLTSRYMTVVPFKYSCPMRHYSGSHFHQLWHFALFGLFNPIKQYALRFLLVYLHPYFPELFLQIVCLRDWFFHG